MQSLAKEIIAIIIDEYGEEELLRRLSDTFWFQALGCVLGYDWHSSGVTTVVTGVLKSIINPEKNGIAVAGGKGKLSRYVHTEIETIGKTFEFTEDYVLKLQYASWISAKVDNVAIQSGYPLYHHVFFLSRTGIWTVIQQGMNIVNRRARRFHWLSSHVKKFLVEPHEAIVCDVMEKKVLNMIAKESGDSRKASVDLVNEGPKRIRRLLKSIRANRSTLKRQTTLNEWIKHDKNETISNVDFLNLPQNISWKSLERAYNLQPNNYEALLTVKGIGSATIRGLALISEIIYGQSPSWKDPVKYSFAYGGKDGVPFPINKKSMDTSIQFLREAVEQSKIRDKEKLLALKRLKGLVPKQH